MIRVIFLVFLFFNFLNASILKDIQIFQTSDKSLNFEDIKDSKNFKRVKLPLVRHSTDTFFVKLIFDRTKMQERSYSVELLSEFTHLKVHGDIPYITVNQAIVIDQSLDNFKDVVYLEFGNEHEYINFSVNIYEANEYAAFQILIGKLYGISYGIIFAAFLYYMALYIFNRQKSYIYYSLTQLSLLIMIYIITQNFDDSTRYPYDLIFLLFFVLSNLFTRSFLNTKENSPKLDKVLFYVMIVFIVDTLFGVVTGIYFVEDNFPTSILLLTYLIAGVIVYNQGYKPALFYLIAWSVIISSFLFVETQIFFTDNSFLIRPDYIIHITAPLESLILAFALSYKMKILEEEKLQQQEFLTHQTKLASMGEMIGNIAHQWRQPLTHLSYIMMNLKTAFEKDRLTSEYFEKKSSEATAQLNYMSHTIDDFRNFFKVNKNKEEFSIVSAIDEVITLLGATFKNHNIQVDFKYKNDLNFLGFRGEFLQVLFNILNNAKDEFIKQNNENSKIEILLEENEKNICIKIKDNAGGIDSSIINKIFEPYFTTKDKGLGMGLYMSNMILNKMNGRFEVENIDRGVQFSINLPKD